ncbi:CocE/NonD family hydrolase [Paenibacillus ehimensis]|uniref:CocE/NonD family hydrolase n=1 Tax=Paenibacillus ehimensis TaxID=79264 RepID=UPI00046F5AAA|nr:CocE/NonD family hydrolase [Paenibacillus ehimensis]
MTNRIPIDKIITEKNVPVPMRDGVTLYADIYRPDSSERHPVLLMRTPYNKADAQTMNYAHPSWYAQHGYVVIVQDTRGRWESEGEFQPYRTETEDGYDTIEWAAGLPYAIPKIGMYGFSYAAAVQWLAAVGRPPHLTCIAPAMIGSDSYQGKTYRSGAFALASIQSWVLFVAQDTALRQGRTDWAAELAANLAGIHGVYRSLPLKRTVAIREELAPYYREWLEHPVRGLYWTARSLRERYGAIEVPALHVGGWYDLFVDGTIENFNGVREQGATALARDNQYLVVEPWYHMPWSRYVGELDFGPEAANRIDRLQLEWFARWLKEDASQWSGVAPVQYFVMGDNRWKQSQQWPPQPAAGTPFYWRSASRANSVSGDGALSAEPPEAEHPDTFVYHPSIPVPALGGRSGAVPELTPMGPKNQLPVEVRNDVLVYTSAALEEEVAIEGNVTAVLYAATTAEDTDFVVKLVDVHPDGRAYNIAEGIVRASFRHSLEHPQPVTPGEIVRYEIPLGPTAIVFKKRHAIRVDVTSSLFPTFDRNPNRFMPPGETTEADFATATQTVYHDRLHPSHVLLPIVRSAQETK